MTEQDALAWIADLFEESPENLSADTPRDDVPAWDSLGVLTLLSALDNDFGLVLSDEDVMAIQSIGDVLDVLRRNGKIDG